MNKTVSAHIKSKIIHLIQFIGERFKIQIISDRWYLKILFKHKIGKKLDTDNPLTFNEKIQWLKLYDRNNKYSIMADKYAVKTYAYEILREDICIPTIGVYSKFDDIPLESLPNSFVIKCTHDWNSVIICPDKLQFNKIEAKKKICNALKRNHYYHSLEWAYKNIPPQIIIEPFLSDDGKQAPIDYRVYCFNGTPFFIHLTLNKFNQREVVFLDKNWEPISLERAGLKKCTKNNIKKPKLLNEMLKYASKLSKDIPFLRVDFYIVAERLYLGECTFYPGEGFREFYPYEWNLKLGKMININNSTNTSS